MSPKKNTAAAAAASIQPVPSTKMPDCSGDAPMVKGKAAVDVKCQELIGTHHVHYERNDVYDVMLKRTNLQHTNTFYVIQVLKEDTRESYSVWLRWGAVGRAGQNSIKHFGPDLEKARSFFVAKFLEKTKNCWEERRSFQKVAGKYDLQIYYSADEPDSKNPKIPESKLYKSVQLWDVRDGVCNPTFPDRVSDINAVSDLLSAAQSTSSSLKPPVAAPRSSLRVLANSNTEASSNNDTSACGARTPGKYFRNTFWSGASNKEN